jgi:exopolyphosphatase/guanosine-5'-triphosphate,3'-diphosphate pyrophosphatase
MTLARRRASDGIDEFAWFSETVRLGAGLDRSGRLADDRIEAALVTLRRFAHEATAHGATHIHAVATEAVRVATNGAPFIARIREETGIVVRLIDGDEEAALTFRGLAASTDLSGSFVVADIGGASTEIIAATDGHVREARSLALGSGRLTDRFVVNDPPWPAEVAACRASASDSFSAILSEFALSAVAAERLVVVGGTGEYLGRLVGDERAISRSAIESVLGRLVSLTAAALAGELAIAEARARVLPAGIAIVAALTDNLGPGRIEVARSGIRAGLLLDAFSSEPSPR